MKKSILAICLIMMMTCALTRPAHAQWVVTDPVNLVQNILTALRTLNTVNNQVRQLQNEAEMLVNAARNLERLDINTLNRLRSSLAATERLFEEAQGLAFNVATALEDYERLYPEAYAAAVSRAQLEADRHERWTFSREAIGTAMAIQSQARQNFADDEEVLADLVNGSQAAAGALEAAQATNQLLALQARQLMQSQQLQIAQDRAVALEQARSVAAEERSRNIRHRFMTETTPYTSEAVRGF